MTTNDTKEAIPMTTLLDHHGNPTLSLTPPEIDPPTVTDPGPALAPTAEPRRWGRTVGLVLGALTLLVAVAATAVAIPHLGDGTGDHTVRPQGFDELESEYSFGIGSLTVDLRDVDFPAGVHAISVDHGIGNTEVWLPSDVNYEIVGDLEIGKVDVPGETDNGFANTVTAEGDIGSDATVVLDLETEIGHARVRRG
jgi:hypothetical protein